MSFLGFSAGLPFLLVFSTLSAWLRDAGITLSVIGFFSWVGVTYSIKVVWAPVIDSLKLPFLTHLLGKRRSWMLFAQIGIAAGLMALAELNPQTQIELIAGIAVFIAFCSATQDIVIDAYRIEAVQPEYQAAMAAMYVFGYRVALLASGAGAFYIADFIGWNAAYSAMALLMFIGITTTMLIREPKHQQDAKTKELEHKIEANLGVRNKKGLLARLSIWFSDAVISPFAEFFVRNGKLGLWILSLIALYKMSDITMGVMANPFYLDLGFSKQEIADVSKIFGFFMTIFGASLGGLLVIRYGLMKPLLLGAILVAATNLLFVLLALSEPNLKLLALVVSADNLSGGIATSVFIAYLSSLTNSAYTATQYALFSSLMTLPAKLLGGLSGLIVDGYGYDMFFLYASFTGLPAIILVIHLMRLQDKQEHSIAN
ncbi:MAG: AmpG family muropeptide MFS transporter [Methyloprofundus sp.]|nr:AmpG family muropeptide MFS transporter [Methyloprofundus sp.]